MLVYKNMTVFLFNVPSCSRVPGLTQCTYITLPSARKGQGRPHLWGRGGLWCGATLRVVSVHKRETYLELCHGLYKLIVSVGSG